MKDRLRRDLKYWSENCKFTIAILLGCEKLLDKNGKDTKDRLAQINLTLKEVNFIIKRDLPPEYKMTTFTTYSKHKKVCHIVYQ